MECSHGDRSLPSPSRSPLGRRLAVAVPLAALLAWLAWAQLPGRGLLSLGAPATGGAEWIWIDDPPTRRSPVAFYAVQDFELEAPAPAAELMVAADEEYLVSINGRWVGLGAWRAGATIDRYAVGEWLRPGANRVVIEVRSGRGTGGLLACLTDPASGRALTATDRGWRTVAHHPNGLFQGWGSIAHAPRAISWGRPPTGRWGAVEPGPLRRPPTDHGVRLPPVRARPLGAGGTWRPVVAEVRVPRPARGERGVLLDWGRPVAGHLSLRFDSTEGQRTALLFTGALPVDPLDGAPDGAPDGGGDGRATAEDRGADTDRGEPGADRGEPGADRGEPAADGGAPDAAVIVISGRRGWTDTVARRFRYVAVLGVTPVAETWVDAPAAWESVREPADGRRQGLLGIAPPPLRTPVEDEVWRQLKGLARGRKG